MNRVQLSDCNKLSLLIIILIPIVVYFIPFPIDGFIGMVIIIGVTVQCSKNARLVTTIWISLLITIEYLLYPNYSILIFLDGLIINFIICCGVGRSLDMVISKQNKLKKLTAKYKKIFNNSNDALFIHQTSPENIRGKFIEVNKVACEQLGYTREELLAMTPADIDDNGYLESTEIQQVKKELFNNGSITFETTHVTKQGKKIPVEVSGHLFELEGKKVVFSISRDITKRKSNEAKIEYLSFHDGLTGLYNRDYFEDSLKRLDTERKLPLSIIMGDVNGLKLINDAFGHDKGDELLKIIAKILKSCCREEDIIARWGGDEFVILLPQTNNEEAAKVCQRINQACKEVSHEKKELDEIMEASIALGYSTKTEMKQEIKEVLKEAEKMVYEHKLVESNSFRSSIIASLRKVLLEKDYETKEHAARIKKLAKKMGARLELPQKVLDELVLLADLHDIGKVGISDTVLSKPESLNEEEWKTIKKHPEIGYRIAQTSTELAPISKGILHHHEWWDGSGYPQGLQGEEIPLISRIISIIDAYDVMTHKRPYKELLSKQEAIQELKTGAGTQFDPKLTKAFIALLDEEE